MGKHRTAEEQIQRLLQEADRDLAKGMRVGEICRKLGVSQNTYHSWRRRQQPTEPDDARRVRDLQSEVDRLEVLVADLMLDKQTLQEVARKVVTPNQQRAAASHLTEKFKISERRASRMLGRSRSTFRYRPRQRSSDESLIRDLRRLARRHRRFGYKKIHARLMHLGWKVNVKHVRRLWNELGLRLQKPRKKPRKGVKRGTSVNSCVNQPAQFKNDVWTYDFVADRSRDGRPLKWLTLVDEYTRECLTLQVARSMVGEDVRRVLARVIGRRGAPTRLRSDNGSEFICQALQGWLPSAGTKPIQVAPGSPWENGFIESFNSRFRDEFLDGEEFESEADAQARGNWWRREYNTIRPHGSLSYKTPKQFSDECGRKSQKAESGEYQRIKFH